jgi:phage-related tail protein
MTPEEQIAAQEVTILRQNVRIAQLEKRIAIQQRMINSQGHAIEALKRNLGSVAESVFRK